MNQLQHNLCSTKQNECHVSTRRNLFTLPTFGFQSSANWLNILWWNLEAYLPAFWAGRGPWISNPSVFRKLAHHKCHICSFPNALSKYTHHINRTQSLPGVLSSKCLRKCLQDTLLFAISAFLSWEFRGEGNWKAGKTFALSNCYVKVSQVPARCATGTPTRARTLRQSSHSTAKVHRFVCWGVGQDNVVGEQICTPHAPRPAAQVAASSVPLSHQSRHKPGFDCEMIKPVCRDAPNHSNRVPVCSGNRAGIFKQSNLYDRGVPGCTSRSEGAVCRWLMTAPRLWSEGSY